MTFLEAALEYARRGWPVFPCEVKGKKPLTEHGFKDATCIEIHIKAWWKKWPRANIGIPTGPKTFDVLDVDGQEGLDSLGSLDLGLALQEAPRVSTPRLGLHVYFRGGSLATSARKLPGLDTRGAGGYVIVPPSEGATGLYEWLVEPRQGEALPQPPDALRELVLSRAPAVPLDRAPIAVPDHAQAAILRMAGIPLFELKEGERGERLFKAAASLRARGSEATDIYHLISLANQLLCKPPMKDKEVRSLASSAARYSMSPSYQVHAETIRQAEERAQAAQETADHVKGRADARAQKIAEKAAAVVTRATEQADEIIDVAATEATVQEAIKSEDLETLRGLIEKHTGIRIEAVLQVGRDVPHYLLDLGEGDTIPVGATILEKHQVAVAVFRARQHTGFADLSSKKWPAIRQALAALIRVTDDVELTNNGQTLSWLRDMWQGERLQRRLQKDAETIQRRRPYVEGGYLYVNATGLQSWLLQRGVHFSYSEVGHRIAQVGERVGSGIVSFPTEAGMIQARYWRVELASLMQP